MWNDLLAAIALILVIEGVMPFLSPDTVRRTMHQLTQLPDRVLRTIGLTSMVCGVVLLYLIRHY
jgi:uncharacterized protein YjeT (DUF2065 family)